MNFNVNLTIPRAPVKKEVGRQTTISGKISQNSRNPLSTLSENLPLSQNAVRKPTVSYSKKECAEKKILLPKSTTGVTRGSKLEKRNAENVKSEVAHVAWDQSVRKNLFNVLPKNPPKKPAKKLTLEEKFNKRTDKRKPLIQIEELFAECLYNEEYFSDNCKYVLATETEFVFPKNILTNHIDYRCRLKVVNWLFRIQSPLKLSEITLLTAVRMFDNFLVKVKFSSNNYELLSISCLWIASKIHDQQIILAPKLVTTCSGKYSRYEILAMEKIILKSIKFKVNYPDLSTFLYYFLKDTELETDSKVIFGAMFLLELFTYLIEFSSFSASQLAATALYLTLLQYNMNCDKLLQYIHSCVTQEPIIFNAFAKKMDYNTKQLIKTSVRNEVVVKYSRDDKLNVVQYFTID